MTTTAESLLNAAGGRTFRTILADPPWQFQNRKGKVAPEHRRLERYATMPLSEIKAMPIDELTEEPAHLYLWVPNALLPEGLEVLGAWGFQYKTALVWHKVRKDGGSDGRGVGWSWSSPGSVDGYGLTGESASCARLSNSTGDL
jgi:N6-adenosine-specific RNA methylase IME4